MSGNGNFISFLLGLPEGAFFTVCEGWNFNSFWFAVMRKVLEPQVDFCVEFKVKTRMIGKRQQSQKTSYTFDDTVFF
jgi:hypothetical protein